MAKQLQKRKTQKLRYLINIYCEGLQEKLYFHKLGDILNNDDRNKKKVTLNCINCNGGSANVIARKAISQHSLQETAAIFDHDLKDNEFKIALDGCKKAKIMVGYSSLNFDLFLVLHKLKGNPPLKINNSNSAYETQLKSLYNLQHNEDIKSECVINKIVSHITMNDIENAIKHCQTIVKYNRNNKKLINTPGNNSYYENPDFSIHEVIGIIINKAFSN